MRAWRWILAGVLCLAAAGCGARAELGAPCPPVAGFADGMDDCGPERPVNFRRL